jgi:hypothetical protein
MAPIRDISRRTATLQWITLRRNAMSAKRTSEAVHYHVEGNPLRVCSREETGLGKHPERTLVQIVERSNGIRLAVTALSAEELLEWFQTEDGPSRRRGRRSEPILSER